MLFRSRAYAFKDLLGAEALADREDLANLVVFHCQQAVEKMLKAVLEKHSASIPKIHSCRKLYLLAKKHCLLLELDEVELERFDEVFLDVKYPSSLGALADEGFPSKKIAQRFLESAQHIVHQIDNELNITRSNCC